MKEKIDLEELRQEAIELCPGDEKMGALLLILVELRNA